MSPKERQAREALTEANRIRLLRAETRREIAELDRLAGVKTTASLIRRCPPDWETCQIRYLLKMPDRFGPGRASKVAKVAGISETRQLGKLTDRQRNALAGALTLMAGRDRK